MYLEGGLSLALKDMIKNTDIFIKHFINKDNFQFLLEKYLIFLVKNGELGNFGSAECARRLIEKNKI